MVFVPLYVAVVSFTRRATRSEARAKRGDVGGERGDALDGRGDAERECSYYRFGARGATVRAHEARCAAVKLVQPRAAESSTRRDDMGFLFVCLFFVFLRTGRATGLTA